MKELTLEITGKCTQVCPWCSSGATPKGKHMADEKVYSLLKEYRIECDVVRFSGGEPTLHPELGGFLWYAKERLGYRTILLTNGVKHFIHDCIDEYWINIVSGISVVRVLTLISFSKTVSMHAVLVKGNETNVKNAMQIGLDHEIPVRLLVLQKQGRGANCEPLDLISWTGDKGCDKDNKITVTHDGKVVTCSALKYGECFISHLFKEQ